VHVLTVRVTRTVAETTVMLASGGGMTLWV
jgi:hypothetical protein